MKIKKRAKLIINIKVISPMLQKSKKKFFPGINKVFKVKGLDISTSGVGVLSKYFLSKGAIVDLMIKGVFADSRKSIRTKAKICYAKTMEFSKYRYGMEFLDIKSECEEAIMKFIFTCENRREIRLKI